MVGLAQVSRGASALVRHTSHHTTTSALYSHWLSINLIKA